MNIPHTEKNLPREERARRDGSAAKRVM